jgi:L-aminopeptidase/D-esterase-like protein/GNAT superfamily N-acetyltransferase
MMKDERHNAITDVPGIRVGHAQNDEALTGVTVVLCTKGAVAGMEQRGGASGTRQTDALRSMHLVQKAHAIVLSGGSAFGLDAASGVVKWLEERGIGFETRAAKVPIVPAAILYDLAIGRSDVRPDATMGYAACEAASEGPVAEGNVGAGCGATVGKIYGISRAMKAGLGTASMDLGDGLTIGAMVAVNAFGDVIEPSTGRIIAGARNIDAEASLSRALAQGDGKHRLYGDAPHLADTLAVMKSLVGKATLRFAAEPLENTIIGIVATNADMNKEEINQVAQMAHDGVARAIRPAHTLFDGDTLFALATGGVKADVNTVGAYAAEVVARAIVRAVLNAQPAGGLPANASFRSLPTSSILVREKRAEDAEPLLALARTLPAWFTSTGVESELALGLRREAGLVAEADGEPVGFVTWGSPEFHQESGVMELYWIGVHRDWRGKGVGKVLLRVMEEKLGQDGIKIVEVWTVADTELYPPYAETRAFYRAMGYRDSYVDTVNKTPETGDRLFLRKEL